MAGTKRAAPAAKPSYVLANPGKAAAALAALRKQAPQPRTPAPKTPGKKAAGTGSSPEADECPETPAVASTQKPCTPGTSKSKLDLNDLEVFPWFLMHSTVNQTRHRLGV